MEQSTMRFLGAFLFLTGYFVVEATEWEDKITKICAKEVAGIDENSSKKETPDEKTMKCFVKCIFVKMGAIDENGEISTLKEEMREKVDNFDNLQKALEGCKNIVVDDCEKISELQNCTSKFMTDV